jgi:hypothetical protein
MDKFKLKKESKERSKRGSMRKLKVYESLRGFRDFFLWADEICVVATPQKRSPSRPARTRRPSLPIQKIRLVIS